MAIKDHHNNRMYKFFPSMTKNRININWSPYPNKLTLPFSNRNHSNSSKSTPINHPKFYPANLTKITTKTSPSKDKWTHSTTTKTITLIKPDNLINLKRDLMKGRCLKSFVFPDAISYFGPWSCMKQCWGMKYKPQRSSKISSIFLVIRKRSKTYSSRYSNPVKDFFTHTIQETTPNIQETPYKM